MILPILIFALGFSFGAIAWYKNSYKHGVPVEISIFRVLAAFTLYITLIFSLLRLGIHTSADVLGYLSAQIIFGIFWDDINRWKKKLKEGAKALISKFRVVIRLGSLPRPNPA